MKKQYEGMFILSSDSAPEASKKALDTITGAITREGGSVDNVQEWGKRRLTFAIRKKRDGVYFVLDFSISPDALLRLEKQMSLNDRVLRHTFLCKTKPSIVRVRRRPMPKAEASTTG